MTRSTTTPFHRLSPRPALALAAVILPGLLAGGPVRAQDLDHYRALGELCRAGLAADGPPTEPDHTPDACLDAHRWYLEQRQALVDAHRLGPADDRDYVERTGRWVQRLAESGACGDSRRRLAEAAQLLESLPAGALASFAAASHAAFRCYPAAEAARFQTLDVYPGAAPSLHWGTLGSLDLEAALRFGGGCVGFIDEVPDFLLDVPESDTRVTVEAFSDYGEDLVLVVDGPSGPLCSDDFYGHNPALSESLPAGRYAVYVGEFRPTGYGSSYGLVVSSRELRPLRFGEPPRFGTLTLDESTPRASGEGTAGGPLDARAFDPLLCHGQVDESPSHRLEIARAGQVTIEARANRFIGGDLTLVLRSSDGTVLCNDDYDGLDPALHTWLEPGSYDIHVGQYGLPGASPYVLTVTRESPEVGLLPPLFEEFRLGPEDDEVTPTGGGAPPAPGEGEGEPPLLVDRAGAPIVIAGSSGGPIAAEDYGPGCAGHLPRDPSLSLEIAEPGSYRVEVQSTGDTTLVVEGPTGVSCSDDADGVNPAIVEHLEPGFYHVYVGSYSHGLEHIYVLTVVGEGD